MNGNIFVDATHLVEWGPRQRVGIGRVECAIVRQTIREHAGTEFFVISPAGGGVMLRGGSRKELGILTSTGNPLARAETVIGRVRNGAHFMRVSLPIRKRATDRAIAAYIVNQPNGRGMPYQIVKSALRVIVPLVQGGTALAALGHPAIDPLEHPGAWCFVSFASLAVLARRLERGGVPARLFTVLHDLIPIDHPEVTTPRFREEFIRGVRAVFAHFDRVVCISDHTRLVAERWLERERIGGADKLTTVRLGSFLVEETRDRPSQPVAGLSGRPFALYCSTIEPRKNHLLLLQVWDRLVERLGPEAPLLVFVGSWGWKYDAVKSYLGQRPRLRATVIVLNGLHDAALAWLYGNARFGVYPSITEGWGLGATECLDFGLPVIVSDAPALAEAVQGLMPIVPATAEEAWYAAVLQAATDDHYLAQLRAVIAERYVRTGERDFVRALLASLDDDRDVPSLSRRVA